MLPKNGRSGISMCSENRATKRCGIQKDVGHALEAGVGEALGGPDWAGPALLLGG